MVYCREYIVIKIRVLYNCVKCFRERADIRGWYKRRGENRAGTQGRRVMISRGKFSWKEDWVFVVGGLLVLALLLLDGAVEASFEEKMLNEQIFDLELYLISTIISALANGIMVGLTIVVVAYFVFLVMCICSGRNGKCAWFFAEVDNGVLLRKGKFVYIFWDENVYEAQEMTEYVLGGQDIA